MSLPLLHWCNWASQPDIGLACGRWTTPEWIQPLVLAPGVFMDDGGEFYTFDDREDVDCPGCCLVMP